MKKLEILFERIGKTKRTKIGKKQTIETLINEEGLLLAKHPIEEKTVWIPRIVST